MPLIEWTPALVLGIKSIDDQHRQLVESFNALRQKQDVGQGCAAEDLVERLKTFAAEHFHIEEGYMQAFGYPDAAAHLREHEDFLAAVARFESACTEGSANADGVLGFLETWIGGHLAGADRRLGRYLEDYLR